MNPDFDSLGSKNNIFPSSTLSGLVIIAAGMISIGSLAANEVAEKTVAMAIVRFVNVLMVRPYKLT
ncbi:hypothetical protein swp_2865 [Shewanella piezotolerans WP3]|uniref:Uncharacterized protein n=1 Tax=Shewanella piezotolerans (strain WP3 / JCM 13877) TaxID=225849 RepID=B8CPL5_SHEPW|nr:hypothetical protein swp_2865 [Shewanella piezotolerans WP3]